MIEYSALIDKLEKFLGEKGDKRTSRYTAFPSFEVDAHGDDNHYVLVMITQNGGNAMIYLYFTDVEVIDERSLAFRKNGFHVATFDTRGVVLDDLR